MYRARNLAWPLILVLGCAHYDVQSSGGDAPGIRLSAETSIFVAMPRDGGYSVEPVAGSGAMMVQALISAISVYAQNVSSASAPASLEEKMDTSILTGESERVPRVSYWQLLVEDEHVEKLLPEPLSRYVDAIFAQ